MVGCILENVHWRCQPVGLSFGFESWSGWKHRRCKYGDFSDGKSKSLTCFKISLAFSLSKGLTDPEHRFIKRLSFSMEVSDMPQKIANTSYTGVPLF